MDKIINIEITLGICSVDGHEPSEFTKSIMERISKGEISPNEGTRLINYPRGRAPGFVTVHRYWRPDTASRL